MAVDEPVTTQ